MASSSSVAPSSSAFADLLAKARKGGPRMWTPEHEEHAWCSVACPLTLRARVEAAPGASPAGLAPLLPHILEKLLGQSLDAAPWGVPVVRIERTGDEEGQQGELLVRASLAAAPKVKEGLFEVSTPLGPARLRIEGLEDSSTSPGAAAAKDEEDATVLLLCLPSAWLEPALLRRAWDQRLTDVANPDDPACGTEGSAWRSWLGQWGRIARLQLSVHLGDREPEGTVTLAVTFANVADCRRCAAALGGGRLLVLRGPERAHDASVARCRPSDLQERAEKAQQDHLELEKEIARVDSGRVLQDAEAALPRGSGASFEPLLQLLRKWAARGALQAPSTICEQGRLQEADATACSKPPEAFRRACWHSAFRVVMQIEPCKENAETLALALCEHWHKTHGICIDFDAEDLAELALVLQAVREQSRKEEDTLRRSAEAKALSAEKALLEELEEEENRAEKKREKKKQSKAQRKGRTSSNASASGGGEEGEKPQASNLDEARSLLAKLCVGPSVASTPPCSSPEAGSTPRSTTPAPSTAPAKAARPRVMSTGGSSSRGSAASSAAAAPVTSVRKQPDIEAILAAVRKSEELHQHHQQPPVAAHVKKESTRSQKKKAAKEVAQHEDDEERPGAKGGVSCTSSTTSTAWEVASNTGSSASSETQPRSSSAEHESDPSEAASGRIEAKSAPGDEKSRPAAGPGRPAAAGLSVDTGEPASQPTSPIVPRRPWSEEVEDEESEEEPDGEEEDDPTSPNASPTKTRARRRRRRGGTRAARLNGVAGKAEDIAANAAPTPVCNGRRSVVTWGDLGLGVVDNNSCGAEAKASAPAGQAGEAQAVERKEARHSTAPAAVGAAAVASAVASASARAPPSVAPIVASPSKGPPPPAPAHRPDAAGNGCLATGFANHGTAPYAPPGQVGTPLRDASARVTPKAAWGDESSLLATGAMGQPVDYWSPCHDASARYAVQSPGAGPMSPMSPACDMSGGCWATATMGPTGSPCGDASLRSPHHGGYEQMGAVHPVGYDAAMHQVGYDATMHQGYEQAGGMHQGMYEQPGVAHQGYEQPGNLHHGGYEQPQQQQQGGDNLTSWLTASNMTLQGEDLAAHLRSMAPAEYED